MKRGRPLEVLVSHLEKALGYDTGVKVESPKRLPDLMTPPRRREHDVVISADHGHHKLTIALECRDRSRPVTVEQVEAFSTKCRHTGVNQGIIVSPKGFYKSAMEMAEKLSIRCLSLVEATSFEWLLAPGINMVMRRPKEVSITVLAEGAELQLEDDYELVDLQGSVIPTQILLSELMEGFKGTDWDPLAESGVSELSAEPRGLFVLERSTRKTTPISRIDCRLEYDVTSRLIPFELASYTDKRSGDKIAEAALAEISAGSLKGKLVIVYDVEKGGGVYFVKEPEAV